METYSLSTECFPILRVGRYWGPCNVFDDCEIVDEEGLDKFTVKEANSVCFDKLKECLSPFVTDIKAVSVGDVYDHNYGDTWLNFTATVDTDSLMEFYKEHKEAIWDIPEFREYANTIYRGFKFNAYRDIERKLGHSEWEWQTCLLAALFLYRGRRFDEYQEDFERVFFDGYSDFVKFPEDED